MNNIARYIERPLSTYLKSQIESGNALATKRALQEICRLYRHGWRIIQDQLIGIENGIIGLTFSSADPKVRRWALNTIAQVGRERTCREAILHALRVYNDDAEVLASAIAALYRLCRSASDDLRSLGLPERMVALAALQHVSADELDLTCLPIRVDTADPELMKLGLIIVGLNKAPENIFEPRHDNASIVRALGNHHDPIVSQYSIWAIVENEGLGLKDLGVPLKNIESLPRNVAAWVYQLIGANLPSVSDHQEYIRLGMTDDSPEVRLGLAIGIKESFSEASVSLVLDWFTREMDPEVREQVLDHLIRQSSRSGSYTSHVLAEFERAGEGARDRMLATAAGLPLYSRLSAIKYGRGDGLFTGVAPVQQTFNIGNIQGGAVSVGGDARQTGDVANSYNQQTLEVIRGHLADAEREIRSSVADMETKKGAIGAIEAAQKEPTKDNLSRAVEALQRVEAAAVSALGTGTAVAGIAALIARAAGLS